MTTKSETLPIEDDDFEGVFKRVTKKTTKKMKSNKIGIYVSNHKMVFTLLLALVVVLLWAFIKMNLMNRSYEKQTAELKTSYETQMNSMTVQHMTLTSKVLALAVRSELTRNNKEQVNQFFMSIIKEPGINKVEFVDAKTSKVLLSTDKKDEGAVYPNQVALMTDETIQFTNNSILNIISPVMGLNNKLGVLVMEYKK
ncbi:MAG: hypothetical protein WCJ61_10780 [Paludibacter sp.]